jgi:hypothetical protein
MSVCGLRIFQKRHLCKYLISIYSLFTQRGVTWGRNLVVPDDQEETFVHEYIHHIQQVQTGFTTMQGRSNIEQLTPFSASVHMIRIRHPVLMNLKQQI